MAKMGKGMDSPRGIYSYKENPMKAPRQVPKAVGPGSNPDQRKVNRLLQMQEKQKEAIRGKMGM